MQIQANHQLGDAEYERQIELAIAKGERRERQLALGDDWKTATSEPV